MSPQVDSLRLTPVTTTIPPWPSVSESILPVALGDYHLLHLNSTPSQSRDYR